MIKPYSRVCSRHFRNGDPVSGPDMTLGKKFASPKNIERVKRAKIRSKRQQVSSSTDTVPPSDSFSDEHTHSDSRVTSGSPSQVYMSEVPSTLRAVENELNPQPHTGECAQNEVIINTALLTQIEMLESENKLLRQKLALPKKTRFGIEDIAHDDGLVKVYTGFISYAVLLSFFEFLGPSVNELSYWGGKKTVSVIKRH